MFIEYFLPLGIRVADYSAKNGRSAERFHCSVQSSVYERFFQNVPFCVRYEGLFWVALQFT